MGEAECSGCAPTCWELPGSCDCDCHQTDGFEDFEQVAAEWFLENDDGDASAGPVNVDGDGAPV